MDSVVRAEGTAIATSALTAIRHKDVEYSVTQGVQRSTWHWSAAIAEINKRGRIAPIKGRGTEVTRERAVAGAMQAIDRALAEPRFRMKRPVQHAESSKG